MNERSGGGEERKVPRKGKEGKLRGARGKKLLDGATSARRAGVVCYREQGQGSRVPAALGLPAAIFES